MEENIEIIDMPMKKNKMFTSTSQKTKQNTKPLSVEIEKMSYQISKAKTLTSAQIAHQYTCLLYTSIVKVENNEGSYQTTTEGTTIFAGDKIKIELGSKKVFYDEEEKLTLDEMTIDGNENINLDTSKVKDNKDGNGSGDGTDSNTPNDNNNPNNNNRCV